MRRWLPLFLLPACAPPGAPIGEASLARVDPATCDRFVPAGASVQDAVDAAADGELVCLAAATFTGTLDLTGRTLDLAGLGPARTILDGGGVGTTVVLGGSTVGLESLSIRGGWSAGAGGGLVTGEQTTLDLVDVWFVGNEAGSGGGLYGVHSTIHATDVGFFANVATGGGGGFYLSEASFDGLRVTVARNRAAGGGGVSAGRSGVSLVDSEVVGNSATGDGGGLDLFTSGSLQNVVIAGNLAGGNGGGVSAGGYSSPFVENVTLVGNRAGVAGGAMYVGGYEDAEIRNSILAYNQAPDVGGVKVFAPAGVTFAYSDLWQNGVNVDGTDPVGLDGNLGVAPRFVSLAGPPRAWDLHLQESSPLVDAGDPALLDPDGTVSDMGAYGGPAAGP